MLRNTLYLYVRMTVAAVTGFVTVRIATGVLGVVDYGVFSAVAAAVGLLQALNGAVTLTAQRNLSHAVGLGDADALSLEFSAVAALFALLAALMLAVGWGGMSGWIATGMDIPPDMPGRGAARPVRRCGRDGGAYASDPVHGADHGP